MNSFFVLLSAAVAAFLSLGMWYAFVRPVRQVSYNGVITMKSFQPAHTVKRLQAGANRQSWTEEEIRVPDSYVFQLSLDGLPTPAEYSLDAQTAEGYQVGQRVKVQYEERGFPLMSKRIRVIAMTAP
jgi:hypothetical protein